jgi:colanic acid/amylovoran biosynthesis glycosyltransferase
MKKEKLKILFAHDKQDMSYSETFIKAQIDNLPFTIEYVCVKSKTQITKNSEVLFNKHKFYSIIERIKRKILKISHEDAIYKENLKAISDLNVDLILSQYGPTGTFMMDYAKDLNIKLMVHYHGYDATRYDVLLKHDNYKKMFQQASALIAVSTEMQQQLINIGAPKHKVYHNCYGIDSTKFVKKTFYSGKQIISVGRFTDKKAPQITLYAFSIVLKSVPNARLIMVGDGPLFDACIKLAKAMKIENSVEFAGSKNHIEVAKYMNDSLLFVQHSLKAGSGDCEGTPLAVMEAMSSGLPVVSTRHAGIKDVVIENETGLLVDEMDGEKMAEEIIKLLQNTDMCAQFGQAGHDRIKQDYQLAKYIDNLSQIITKVI